MSSLTNLAANALRWRFVDFAADKVIFLVQLLVLARLLAPEDFGLLAIGVTAINVFLNLSNFGVVPALIQRPNVSKEYYDAGWSIGIIRAAVVVSIVIFAAPWIADQFGDRRAIAIIQVLALGVVLDALASIKLAHLSRDLQFRSIAIVNLVRAIATTTVAISLASAFGVWALVAGSLSGSLFATITSYIVAPYRPRLRWHKSEATELMNYGRWIFLTTVFVMLGEAGLRMIISRKLGVADLGIFFLAARLAYLPYQAVIGVVEPVIFPIYARVQANVEKANDLFRATLLGTATFLIPSYVLLVALAPGLIEHILGQRWADTTTPIQILAVGSALGILSYAAVPLLKGLGLPSRVTIYECVRSSLSLGLAMVLIGPFGLYGAVLAVSIAIFASQPLCILFAKSLLDRADAIVWQPILAIIAFSLIAAIIAGTIDSALPGIAGFVIGAILGGILVLGSLVVADQKFDLNIAYTLERYFPILSRMLFLHKIPHFIRPERNTDD